MDWNSLAYGVGYVSTEYGVFSCYLSLKILFFGGTAQLLEGILMGNGEIIVVAQC